MQVSWEGTRDEHPRAFREGEEGRAGGLLKPRTCGLRDPGGFGGLQNSVLALKVSVTHAKQVKYFHNKTEICLPYQ